MKCNPWQYECNGSVIDVKTLILRERRVSNFPALLSVAFLIERIDAFMKEQDAPQNCCQLKKDF